MEKRSILSLAAIALAPFMLGNAPAPEVTMEEVQKARTILEDNLIDYSSAKMRNWYVVDSVAVVKTRRLMGIRAGTKVRALCGEINSANRFGGLTGWSHYAIILEGKDWDPIHVMSSDYYLADYTSICTYQGTDRMLGPDNAKRGEEDVSALLDPNASPALLAQAE